MKKLFSFIIALVAIFGFSVMPFAAEQPEVKAAKEQKIEDTKKIEKKITGKKHTKSRKAKKKKRTTKGKKANKAIHKKVD